MLLLSSESFAFSKKKMCCQMNVLPINYQFVLVTEKKNGQLTRFCSNPESAKSSSVYFLLHVINDIFIITV